MATSQMSAFIQHLRRAALRDGAGLTDGQLLEDYISHRDEAALAALVQRHGPMVWGVCRRVLSSYHDAEDAFQATFLVLVRKAASIASKELLANWLYGVAHQTALKARATTAKRCVRERQVTEMPEPAPAEQDLWGDLQPLLDEELSRLPDKYRVVLVLCDLEEKTRREAARQLGVPEGTVASRLATARRMLAKRLARHGLAVSGGALAAMLTEKVASAGAPTSVVSSTIKAVTLIGVGRAAATGAISVKVAALTEGVMKSMLLTKLKATMAGLLLMGALVSGVGAIYRAQAAEQPEKSSEALVFLESPKEQRNKKERSARPLTLTSKELSGTWQGEKDGVKVQITFRDNGKDAWEVIVQKSPNARDLASAELTRVDDKQSGTVRLRFDTKLGSVVVGQVERDKAGAIRLNILPDAAKHGPYRPVEGIPIHAAVAGRP